jgi:hypothetical protein
MRFPPPNIVLTAIRKRTPDRLLPHGQLVLPAESAGRTLGWSAEFGWSGRFQRLKEPALFIGSEIFVATRETAPGFDRASAFSADAVQVEQGIEL